MKSYCVITSVTLSDRVVRFAMPLHTTLTVNSVTYGQSTRLPPMWPGFESRTRRQMWVEFVAGSRPCSERFFSRYSGFPFSSKTNISKFQFDLYTVDEKPPCGCATANSHLFYFTAFIKEDESFADKRQLRPLQLFLKKIRLQRESNHDLEDTGANTLPLNYKATNGSLSLNCKFVLGNWALGSYCLRSLKQSIAFCSVCPNAQCPFANDQLPKQPLLNEMMNA